MNKTCIIQKVTMVPYKDVFWIIVVVKAADRALTISDVRTKHTMVHNMTKMRPFLDVIAISP